MFSRFKRDKTRLIIGNQSNQSNVRSRKRNLVKEVSDKVITTLPQANTASFAIMENFRLSFQLTMTLLFTHTDYFNCEGFYVHIHLLSRGECV